MSTDAHHSFRPVFDSDGKHVGWAFTDKFDPDGEGCGLNEADLKYAEIIKAMALDEVGKRLDWWDPNRKVEPRNVRDELGDRDTMVNLGRRVDRVKYRVGRRERFAGLSDYR